MTVDEKNARWEDLRARPARTPEQDAEMAALKRELLDHHDRALAATLERMDRDHERAEREKRALLALIERRNALRERLEATLRAARAESAAIETEFRSAVADIPVPVG